MAGSGSYKVPWLWQEVEVNGLPSLADLNRQAARAGWGKLCCSHHRIYSGRAGAKAGSFKMLFRDNPSFGPTTYSFPVTELNLHNLKLTVLLLSLV